METEMSDTPRNLVAVIAEVLDIPEADLADSSSPESVSGWDSAKSMELVVYLEDLFELQFSADEIAAMSSVGEIRKLLIAKGLPVL